MAAQHLQSSGDVCAALWLKAVIIGNHFICASSAVTSKNICCSKAS